MGSYWSGPLTLWGPSQLQQKPRLSQYPAPWANKPCWNMKIFSRAEVPGKAVMLLLKPVFPYCAALNQVGIPWVDQHCLVWCWNDHQCPELAEITLPDPTNFWNVFPIQAQDIKKKKKIPAYFRLGQLKCFNCVLLGFSLSWVFLQKFELFQTEWLFSPICKMSKKGIFQSEIVGIFQEWEGFETNPFPRSVSMLLIVFFWLKKSVWFKNSI